MTALSCRDRVQAIYAIQAQEDPTMTMVRARTAHKAVCKLGEHCEIGHCECRCLTCDKADRESEIVFCEEHASL